MVLWLLLAACHHKKAQPPTIALAPLVGEFSKVPADKHNYRGKTARVLFNHTGTDCTIAMRYVNYQGDSIIAAYYVYSVRDSLHFYDSVYHFDSAVLR